MLEGAECKIKETSEFSRKRWNAYRTIIDLFIHPRKLILVNEDEKNKLIDICNIVMPDEVGFDVMEINFLPLIKRTETKKTLFEELEEIVNSFSQEIIGKILPDDIKQKGKDMAEVYLHLYCVENSLRLFIEIVARDKLGNNYFNQLRLNKDIRKKIQGRKQKESKNMWLRLRGDSEIFYLDFKDLGAIIQNNWDLFEPYFPDQNWVITKINELSECRNLVAHNSYIQSHEKDVIRVNYNSILKQLNMTLKNQN